MKYGYASANFGDAMRTLATHPGSIQERLYHAYVDWASRVAPGLSFIAIPPDLLPDITRLRAALTWAEPKGDEGTIAATCRIMSADEAARLAGLICDISFRLDTYRDDDRLSKAP